MYSFPHPQAIFDGGGKAVHLFVNRNVASGVTDIFIDYLVEANAVLHLLHVYGRYDPAGTAGDIFLVLDLADISNAIKARLVLLHGAFNTPLPDTTFAFPLHAIVPAGLKILGRVANRINTTIYVELGFYAIEYEVFRT
jgi:hypothetical protein